MSKNKAFLQIAQICVLRGVSAGVYFYPPESRSAAAEAARALLTHPAGSPSTGNATVRLSCGNKYYAETIKAIDAIIFHFANSETANEMCNNGMIMIGYASEITGEVVAKRFRVPGLSGPTLPGHGSSPRN
jgi:hypothetical protein